MKQVILLPLLLIVYLDHLDHFFQCSLKVVFFVLASASQTLFFRR